MSMESCPMVKNILLLDSEGKRVAVKYSSDDWPTNSAKLAFEKSVFTKTLKSNARIEAEIAMFENNIVIYKFFQDLHFFVTGGDDENEVILATVLQGFFDAVGLLLREALENLDLILLCLDEIVDGGYIIMEKKNIKEKEFCSTMENYQSSFSIGGFFFFSHEASISAVQFTAVLLW
ncbi:hypothetical protein ACJW31_05G025000 [Castanea mollissima]